MIERRTSRMATTVAMALGLFLAGTSAAQNIARVNFMISLPDGQPVRGVQIIVTSKDRPGFEQKLKTSKRGEAIFTVNDTEHNYQVAIKYEDYELVELEVRPRPSETIVRRIVLSSSKEAAPSGAASGEAAASPPAEGLGPAETKFNEGVEAAMDSDFATAKAKFLEALELDANLAPAHQAVSGLFLDEKDYETAVRHASRAVEIDPENTRAYRVLYEAHRELGNEAEAAEALAKLGEGSSSADVVYNEGVAALREGDAETAKASFEKALELESDLMPAVSALALVYLQEESYERAAEMAERLLATSKDDPRMLRVRWRAYRGLGDKVKEKEAFDTFASGNPGALATELFNTGAELFDAGDAQGARESFESVLAIDPDHPRGHYQLALCLVQQGDTEGAREHFERFIELAPGDPEVAMAKEMLTYLKK